MSSLLARQVMFTPLLSHPQNLQQVAPSMSLTQVILNDIIVSQASDVHPDVIPPAESAAGGALNVIIVSQASDVHPNVIPPAESAAGGVLNVINAGRPQCHHC